MNKYLLAALGVAFVTGAGIAATPTQTKARVDKGKIGLFEGNNFDLKSYDAKGARPRVELEFNISSIAVYPGERWEVCAKLRYQPPCMTIDQDTQNLNGIAVMSVRPIKDQ